MANKSYDETVVVALCDCKKDLEKEKRKVVKVIRNYHKVREDLDKLLRVLGAEDSEDLLNRIVDLDEVSKEDVEWMGIDSDDLNELNKMSDKIDTLLTKINDVIDFGQDIVEQEEKEDEDDDPGDDVDSWNLEEDDDQL